MFTSSWISNLFSFQSPKTSKKTKPFRQLNLLNLEERIVPALLPPLLSINPTSDNRVPLVGTSADFTVTFDSPVTGVDAKDFTTVTTGKVWVGPMSVTGSGTTYHVNVPDVFGSGTLAVNLVDSRSISLSFAEPGIFATGTSPHSVTMGDVNGDGGLDIVTANRGHSTVSVLLGTGDGNFSKEKSFGVNYLPSSVALGDVNGDGRLDIVTANSGNNNTSVLLGNGDGTFKNENTFGVGNYPQSVALGDVNGDGRLDIATANHSGDNTSVLLGNGDGTFADQKTFPLDRYPISIALGDVNNDGRVDIVTANEGRANTSVLLGNGDGSFADQTTFAVGTSPVSVTLGDVNNDGRLDIVTVNNYLVAKIYSGSVLLGIGNGTFADQTTFAVGNRPTAVTLGDVNGDGKPDIVTGNSGGNHSSVLLGDGKGAFVGSTTFLVNRYCYSVKLGDVNGDGRLDIVAANSSSGTVHVRLGVGVNSRPLQFSTTSTPSTGNAQRSIATGDVNGDGKLDIVASNFGNKNASVLLGNGNGTFQNQKTFATGDIPLYVTVGDVNSDGKLDIVTANSESNTVSVLLGDGKGAFGGPTTLAVGSYSFAVKLGDVNGDGKLDIVTVNQRSSNLSILLGNGDGTFKNQSTFALGSNPDSLALGDVNGDGRLDIVTTNFGSIAGVLLGNGDGTFQDLITFPVDFRIGSVVLGDVNADGILDIVAENALNDSASVHLGNGNGTFKSQTTFAVGDTPLSASLGDVNNDGRLDIITTNNLSNTTSVLLGNGNGTFKSQTTFAVESFPDCVVLGDVNNDGRLDIITANRNNNVSVLLNSLGSEVQAEAYPIDRPAYPPIITSPGKVYFYSALENSFTITATPGLPTATTFSIKSGKLPPRVSFNSTTGVISGIPPKYQPAQFFHLVIIASNDVAPDSVQDLTLTVPASPSPVVLRASVPSKRLMSKKPSAGTELPPSVGSEAPPSIGTEVALSVGTEVTLRDPVTGNATKTITPFPGFSGEVRVAVGDTTGDGNLETILSAGPGGGPAILVVNSTTGEVMSSFFAYDPAFRGGVFVATQDVNNDGSMDIVTGAGPGGSPHVKVFNRGTNESILEFFAYDTAFQGGVTVACADINNDGVLEIITGAGPGGAPHVKVFDGATGTMISQWFAYDSSFRGGVFVAVADLDNDGNFEVITGAGEGGAPVVAIWNAMNGSLINQFLAYDPEFRGGVRVGIADENLDGDLELVTGPGPGGGPHIKVFEYPELNLLFSFFNGDPDNRDGVFVS